MVGCSRAWGVHSNTARATTSARSEYRADNDIYGQFMKSVAAGAVRTASSAPSDAPAHSAFRNPDGRLVLVAANPGSRAMPLVVEWKDRTFTGREVRGHVPMAAVT
jgi:hypothetical protein